MSEALAALEAELKRDPSSRRFAELAREYQRLGRMEEARTLCEQGLQRHPTLWQARLLLAQIQVAKDDLEGAGASVQKILLALPDNVAANHLAGDIYLALGDRAAALKHFQVVELFEPGRSGVAARIAELSAPPQAVPPPPPEASQEAFEPPVAEPQTIPLPTRAEKPAEAPDTTGETAGAGAPEPEPPRETVAPPEDFAGTIRIPAWNGEEGPPAAELEDIDQTAPSEVLADGEDSFSDLSDGEDGLGEALLEAHEQTLTEMPPLAAPAVLEPEGSEGDEAPPEPPAPQALRSMPDGQEAEGPALSTTTLAELYSQQGFPEKAVEIYQRVLLQDPERPDIKRKVQELMQRITGEAPEIPEIQQEDVRRALRQRRVQVLEGWLRRVKEERHV